MNFLLTLVILIIILGLIVFVHVWDLKYLVLKEKMILQYIV